MPARTTAVAASLPDLGEPVTVAFFAAFFSFVTGAWSTLTGKPREDRTRRAADGAWLGTGFGLALYGIGLATGLY